MWWGGAQVLWEAFPDRAVDREQAPCTVPPSTPRMKGLFLSEELPLKDALVLYGHLDGF